MKASSSSYDAWLISGIAALVTVASASADPTPPDLSDCKCAQCPFLQGYETQSEAGVLFASGANATYGRYTGVDHNGAYADVSGSGKVRSEDGSYVDYDLGGLGL